MITSWLAVGCRTTGAASEPSAMEEIPTLPPLSSECPVAAVVCETERNPVLCTVSLYNQRRLPESLVLAVRAEGDCAGRLALRQEACMRDLLPSRLGPIQCVPDASGGHCPFEVEVCDGIPVPTRCTAGRYGTQVLSSEQALVAYGSNECKARQALMRQACRLNLDPQALADIVCVRDALAEQCPPKEHLCTDALRPATCQLQVALSNEPARTLVADGASDCEARQNLARQACLQGVSPHPADAIECKFRN